MLAGGEGAGGGPLVSSCRNRVSAGADPNVRHLGQCAACGTAQQQGTGAAAGGKRLRPWKLPGFDEVNDILNGEEPAGSRSSRAPAGRSGYQRETVIEAAMKSAARSVASSVANQLGRALVRGILGSLKR